MDFVPCSGARASEPPSPTSGSTTRATLARRTRRRGVGLDVVAKALGHKSLRMTMRYAHIEPVTMRAAMPQLPALVTLATASRPRTPFTHKRDRSGLQDAGAFQQLDRIASNVVRADACPTRGDWVDDDQLVEVERHQLEQGKLLVRKRGVGVVEEVVSGYCFYLAKRVYSAINSSPSTPFQLSSGVRIARRRSLRVASLIIASPPAPRRLAR